VSINWFLKLKEIDSLTKMRGEHLKALIGQDDRLTKLYNRQHDSHLQTVRLQKEMFTLQQSMHDVEQKLKLYQKQRTNLMDIGESGKKYDIQIDDVEGQGFALMAEIEKNENELKDLAEFSTGLERTINEITHEATIIKSEEEQAIKNLNLRLSLLEDELPSHFKEMYKKVSQLNLPRGSFTRIEDGSCYFCRYKISRLDESEIDMQQEIKQCPQCRRIFLPYGS
jgi:predicted  nucleic acid-binding Zn-ribbon protein